MQDATSPIFQDDYIEVFVDMATITAQATNASPADASLPRFTPSPDCLTDLYRTTTECGSEKTSCTYFHVGKRWSYDACLPNERHPATACPVSYTDIESLTLVEADGKTAVTLRCCPQSVTFALMLSTGAKLTVRDVTTEDMDLAGRTQRQPQLLSAPRTSISNTCLASQPNPPFQDATAHHGPCLRPKYTHPLSGQQEPARWRTRS